MSLHRIWLLPQVQNNRQPKKKNVISSLQPMIVGLQKRPLVSYIYITVSCNSRTPIHRRDLKKSMIMNELPRVIGDAQGIQYLI
ncbi:hypothetical protein CU097_008768 [Rhizopus azygosporus]|uniref:Uncharacterized protein n=1 Tax=Rhizopus azygosporus TaxID=86630 RepID=A0A367J9A9_RHIAZ|nr:hypothetical protein CU097_008768 [Rhizopus azygosporus]